MSSTDQTIAANQQAQRDLYGETLESRISKLTERYGISQRRLAQTLGISAPMLSQLISARRVKMGNTLAYERMVTLEKRASEAADPASVQRVLDEVAASDVATTLQMRTDPANDRRRPSPLATIPQAQLRAARERLAADGTAPDLVSLIDAALG